MKFRFTIGFILGAVLGVLGFWYDYSRAAIEKTNRDAMDRLGEMSERVRKAEERATEIPALEKQIEESKAQCQKKEAELGALKTDADAKQQEIDRLRKEFDDYKTRYRASARACATGDQFAELTVGSTTYRIVTLTHVDPAGIEIRHSGGSAMIPFAQLSQEWRDRFDYDVADGTRYEADQAHIRQQVDLQGDRDLAAMGPAYARAAAADLVLKQELASVAVTLQALNAQIEAVKTGTVPAPAAGAAPVSLSVTPPMRLRDLQVELGRIEGQRAVLLALGAPAS